jgi:hypothetical protein
VTAYLPLAGLPLDHAVVRRLPRALALHHLALVVAEDEDSVTVALADPTNPTSRQRIQSALGANLTIVRSDADAIRAALNRAWSDAPTRGGLVIGGSVPLRPMLTAYAQRVILPAFPALAIESSLPPRLLLTYEQTPERRAAAIIKPESSVWVCVDPARDIKTVLVAIRTGPPDWQAAEWAAQLAHAYGGSITLMASTGSARSAILSPHAAYLSADDPRGAHVADLALILTGHGLTGRLKVREGSFVDAAIAECLAIRPDLLIIGAEQAGQQAAHILTQVAEVVGGLLVLKG